MRNRFPKILALVAVLALVAAACGGDDDDAADTTSATETTAAETTTTTEAPAATEAPATIVDVAVASGQFPTLVAALQATGLDEVLAGDGPFTVFAPTEDAFAAALEALGLTAEELLADTDTLTNILTYHVLGETVTSADITAAGTEEIPVTTVQGAELVIIVGDAGNVSFKDQSATVTDVDIEASNGVIHVIDAVLLPPSN